MKTTKLTLGWRSLATAGVLCVLAGCGGQPQEYFRLSAVSGAPVRTSGMAVGVGPVTLPGYIDRTQLVFQSGPNEFQVPAKASWAGPLGENVTQVLADDVGRHLGSGNVLRYPWAPGAHLRYQVAVNVEQFHGISGSEAILDVSWLVEEPDSRQILSRHKVSLHEPIHGDGYAAVVDAESQLLDQLAVAVARSLER
jgi:uncharacterized lipoprotein YmbA